MGRERGKKKKARVDENERRTKNRRGEFSREMWKAIMGKRKIKGNIQRSKEERKDVESEGK